MALLHKSGLDGSLHARVGIRQEESDVDSTSGDCEFGTHVGSNGRTSASSEDFSEDNEMKEQSDSEHIKSDMGSVSFHALAEAQASLGKRKRQIEGTTSDPEALKALRARLQEMKERQGNNYNGEDGKEERRAKDIADIGRTSKHAPAEISSKKAVSRKREVVSIAKRDYRDPRFEPLNGHLDESSLRRRYSFLDVYRTDERISLKNEIKKTKDGTTKEKLKRALLSMESKKQAQDAKDKQQEILRRHRSAEKDLIKRGKKPFYLKESEKKRLALVDRYSNLKGKQLDRILERKRKKKASKEKQNMPWTRRDTDAELL
ncbi:MAG: rRNA biogenesis protein rrp36 [Candelina submexicana]|nr:MAG: rRNA biogenesis protein rrp36 [Candelina submexicana]